MIAVVKHIIVLSKIVIETNYSKPDRGFRGILSNIGLCLPPPSRIVNLMQTLSAKRYVCAVNTFQDEPGIT
jgi:hypothetical protein